tara:strand:+ start:434 stop:793 length:360 start_codon:yes stop_codon:yes gene_type:complete
VKKIIIKKKFDLFNDYWNPKIIGKINNHDVKLAKVKGEFVWHNHKNEDELFFIIKGKLNIEFHDKKVELNEGEMLIVPKGVDHKPIAKEEVWLLLFEPNNIKHTGDVISNLTVENYEKI